MAHGTSASAKATGSAGGTSAAASATPTPTAAGSASAQPADCPSTHATYAACGFPTAQTTGWQSAGTTTLKNVTSPGPTGQGSSYATEIKTNGAVINGLNITGGLDVYANNVTIENSRITTRNWFGINQRNGFHGLKVIHCTIIGMPGKGLDHGGEDYGISDDGNYLVAAYNDIYGFGEGITSGEGYFHDNYGAQPAVLHPARLNSYQHTNALIDSGGSGIKVVHNTFLNWMPPSKGGIELADAGLRLGPGHQRGAQRQLAGRRGVLPVTPAGSPARTTSSSPGTSSAPSSSAAAGSTA